MNVANLATLFFFYKFFSKKNCGKYFLRCAQIQLASAKLAICLKNSVFGFEKPSFFRGLRFSFFATFLMYRSVKSLKFDFLGDVLAYELVDVLDSIFLP